MKKRLLVIYRVAVLMLVLMVFFLPKSTYAGIPPMLSDLDAFSSNLALELSSKFFDENARPVIKIVIMDFVDELGNITLGSQYVSNYIRFYLGLKPQFLVIPVMSRISPDEFSADPDLRTAMKIKHEADLYLSGTTSIAADMQIEGRLFCWGEQQDSDEYNLLPLALKSSAFMLSGGFSPSTCAMFNSIIISSDTQANIEVSNSAEVIFLTQYICDDSNPYWGLKNGVIIPKLSAKIEDRKAGDYGKVFQSRIKEEGGYSDVSYVIKSFSLLLKGMESGITELEPYQITKSSNFYAVPTGIGDMLQFQFLWGMPGLGSTPFVDESSMGWNFMMAEKDWSILLPTGNYTVIAAFKPIIQRTYGSVNQKPEIVREFSFSVEPGLNVFLVNFAYQRDNPAIFFKKIIFDENIRDNSSIKIKDIR